VLVTGANQGGKSTFLRSVGLAQLLAQAGAFVGATTFRSTLASGLFSHFERGEDPTMRSGRLDAELREMSAIVDQLRPGDLLLCNESFGSTNEREGSLLAQDIVRALTAAGIRVFYVTHLYDLADRLHAEGPDGICFLRAERREDGQRTFRMRPGVPLPTSHGQDLYAEVFGPGEPVGGDEVVDRG
jgi:DNA mismatch repair ATPase MutS